ncbi:MAG: hypothetical protein P1P82_16025 [Bacteroidales bacterium]|nr:hypothetical protein [Bacteroidales bacterium]
MKNSNAIHSTGSGINRLYQIMICRRLILCLLIVSRICGYQAEIYAQQSRTLHGDWYIGTNPVAIPLAFNIKPESKRFLPIVAGNEYGTNLVGTCFFRPNQSIEGRLSLSNVYQVAFVGQLHMGSNYFFQNNKISNGQKGWYFGAYFKYWDFYNQFTHIHFHNISPYLSLGYMKEMNRLLFDFRLNQTLSVLSWSSLAYTKANADWMLSPWPEFITVLPTITFTVSLRI